MTTVYFPIGSSRRVRRSYEFKRKVILEHEHLSQLYPEMVFAREISSLCADLFSLNQTYVNTLVRDKKKIFGHFHEEGRGSLKKKGQYTFNHKVLQSMHACTDTSLLVHA